MGGSWSMVYTATLGATIMHTERNTEFVNVITNQYPAVFDDHSATLAEMRTETDPYPGSVASQATNLGGEIERLRYKLGQIDDSLATILGVSANTYYYEDSPSGTVGFTVLNKTADYLITAANCNGLTEINNANDTGVIVFTLPDATVGLAIKIKCSYQAAGGVSNTITINPDAGDTFTVGATTGLTALTTSVVGSIWELTCEVAGVWIASLKGVQPFFRSTMSGNQSISSSNPTKVVFNTVAAGDDNNNVYDKTTNYRHTPVIPGRYKYNAYACNAPGYTGQQKVNIYKNNSAVRTPTGYGTNGYETFIKVGSGIIMDDNDYVEIFFEFTNAAASSILAAYSWFEAERISD